MHQTPLISRTQSLLRTRFCLFIFYCFQNFFCFILNNLYVIKEVELGYSKYIVSGQVKFSAQNGKVIIDVTIITRPEFHESKLLTF